MQKPFFIVTGRLKLQAAALQKIHLFPEGADFLQTLLLTGKI